MSQRTQRRRAAQRTAVQGEAAFRIDRLVRAHGPMLLAGIAALHLLLAFLAFDPTPHTGGDNAGYLTLARSLLGGEYRDVWDPAEPLHTKYPPAFPAILALAMLVGVQPWVGFKVIVVAFSALAVTCTFLWIRGRHRPALALGVTAIVALSPGVHLQNHWVLSDVPFWALTMLALWALERLPARTGTRLILATVALLLAYFTRSAGLPLVLAAFAWLALTRRWTQLSIVAAALLPPAFIWWLRARSAGGVDYVGELWLRNPYDPSLGTIGVSDLFGRMGANLLAYVQVHVPVALFGQPNAIGVVLTIALVLCALYGWARRLRRPGVAELLLPLYVGLIFIWPAVWAGDRFILPVLPLLLYYGGDGLVRVARRLHPRAAFGAGAAATALILLLQLPTLGLAAQLGGECRRVRAVGGDYACLPEQWQDYFALAQRAGTVLPADAAVLTRKPRHFYVASGGIHSTTFPFTDDARAFFAFADSVGARYVTLDAVDGLASRYVVPVVMAQSARFCILETTGRTNTALLGILPTPAAAPAADPSGAPAFPPCPANLRR